MRDWRVMLGPFLIWTAHFAVVYGVASVADIAPPQAGAWQVAGIAFSALCLAALVVTAVRLRRRTAATPLARGLGLTGSLVGFIAVAWQSLPLLLSA